MGNTGSSSLLPLPLNLKEIERQADGPIPALEALGNKDIGAIIFSLLPYVFGVAGLTILLYFIWGGFLLMTSHGDQKAVESAKQKITGAVVGFVIIFAAYWLVQLAGNIFGIDIFKAIFI